MRMKTSQQWVLVMEGKEGSGGHLKETKLLITSLKSWVGYKEYW